MILRRNSVGNVVGGDVERVPASAAANSHVMVIVLTKSGSSETKSIAYTTPAVRVVGRSVGATHRDQVWSRMALLDRQGRYVFEQTTCYTATARGGIGWLARKMSAGS